MNGAMAYDKHHQIHLSPALPMFTDSLVTTDFRVCMNIVHVDLLQTFNISWLLINLHHHPVRVGWLKLSWLASTLNQT